MSVNTVLVFAEHEYGQILRNDGKMELRRQKINLERKLELLFKA